MTNSAGIALATHQAAPRTSNDAACALCSVQTMLNPCSGPETIRLLIRSVRQVCFRQAVPRSHKTNCSRRRKHRMHGLSVHRRECAATPPRRLGCGEGEARWKQSCKLCCRVAPTCGNSSPIQQRAFHPRLVSLLASVHLLHGRVLLCPPLSVFVSVIGSVHGRSERCADIRTSASEPGLPTAAQACLDW